MTGNVPAATAPDDELEAADPLWLEDLQEDLRRVATRPEPFSPRRGLLGRLLEPQRD